MTTGAGTILGRTSTVVALLLHLAHVSDTGKVARHTVVGSPALRTVVIHHVRRPVCRTRHNLDRGHRKRGMARRAVQGISNRCRYVVGHLGQRAIQPL